MEKIPANNEGSINDTIINVPIRNTNIGVDVKKCSQCDFIIWRDIGKHTVQTNQTNAIFVTMHPIMRPIWEDI